MLVNSAWVGFISFLKPNSSKRHMLACVFLILGKHMRPLLMGQACVLKRFSSVVPDWQQDRLDILARVWHMMIDCLQDPLVAREGAKFNIP